MKKLGKIFLFLASAAAVLALIKLVSEALGLGTHKYIDVDNNLEP